MRRLTSRSVFVVSMAVMMSLLVVAPANAYLDAGTGSMIFQAVIAGGMAVAVGVKAYWSRIRRLFTRSQATTVDAEE